MIVALAAGRLEVDAVGRWSVLRGRRSRCLGLASRRTIPEVGARTRPIGCVVARRGTISNAERSPGRRAGVSLLAEERLRSGPAGSTFAGRQRGLIHAVGPGTFLGEESSGAGADGDGRSAGNVPRPEESFGRRSGSWSPSSGVVLPAPRPRRSRSDGRTSGTSRGASSRPVRWWRRPVLLHVARKPGARLLDVREDGERVVDRARDADRADGTRHACPSSTPGMQSSRIASRTMAADRPDPRSIPRMLPR